MGERLISSNTLIKQNHHASQVSMYRSCKHLGLVLQELPPRFETVRRPEALFPIMPAGHALCLFSSSPPDFTHSHTPQQMVDARQPLKRLMPWREAAAQARASSHQPGMRR